MVVIKIDPFEGVRKNSHIWRGERAVLWYHETLNDAPRLTVLYDLGDKKRRLALEIDPKNGRVEFKNDEIDDGLYAQLVEEIRTMEALLREPQPERKDPPQTT